MIIGRLILATALSLFLLPNGVAQEAQSPPPASAEQPEPEQAPPPPAGDEPRTLEQIFIPSEEIGADEEVTFPINI